MTVRMPSRPPTDWPLNSPVRRLFSRGRPWPGMRDFGRRVSHSTFWLAAALAEYARYIRRILANASADRWHRLARQPEQALPPRDCGPGVRDHTAEVADRDFLLRAQASLPPRQRAARGGLTRSRRGGRGAPGCSYASFGCRPA